MNAEGKALLRVALLRGLAAAAPASLPRASVMDVARNAGFPEVGDAELQKELHYLTGKELLEETENPFSVGQKRWKIAPAGVEMLEREGLL